MFCLVNPVSYGLRPGRNSPHHGVVAWRRGRKRRSIARPPASRAVLFHIAADPSRRRLVVIQQSSQARAPTHTAGRVGRGRPRDQPIVESLVIPFEMIVRDKLDDRASEVLLPQRNHAIQAFLLDRPHESLGVRIRVGGRAPVSGPRGCRHRQTAVAPHGSNSYPDRRSACDVRSAPRHPPPSRDARSGP